MTYELAVSLTYGLYHELVGELPVSLTYGLYH
jgi:hypothetical protein